MTHFVRTSGSCLLTVEIQPRTFTITLPLLRRWLLYLILRVKHIHFILRLRAYSTLKSTLYPWLKGKGEVKVDFSYPYPTLTLTLVGTLRVYPTYLWWAEAQKWDQQCQGCPYYLRKSYPIQFRSSSSSSRVYIVCWPFTTTSSDIAGQKSLLQWL